MDGNKSGDKIPQSLYTYTHVAVKSRQTSEITVLLMTPSLHSHTII